MRLLLVSDTYPPLIGGATRAASLLAQELAARGNEVVIATYWQDHAPSFELDGPVRVHRIPGLTTRLPWFSADPYRRNAPPFPDLESAWHLRALMRRYRPDVVHSYGWLTYSCVTAMIGLDTPLILSARDYGNICAKRTLVHYDGPCSGPAPRKCLDCAIRFYGPGKGAAATAGVFWGRRGLRKRVRALHSCSSYVRDVLHEFLFDRQGLLVDGDSVLPDFRVADATPPDPTILAHLPTEPFILYVGAFRAVKGIEILLQAYGQLRDPPPLVLMGTRALDTPDRWPEGVVVLENVPHATVMAAWSRSLFGVAPSVLPEPLGNVVHEAMSCGRPVIGTRPGGHADMIDDGIDGLLVPGGDVEALSNAMQRLVADDSLRARLAGAAVVSSARFTADVVVPGFEELYRRVASRARST